MKKSLYDKNKYDKNNKSHKSQKDLFTDEQINNMTIVELKSSTIKYEKQIEKKTLRFQHFPKSEQVENFFF